MSGAFTSHEREDFSYLASAIHVEALIAVTRIVVCALESCGAIVELDPQRDEDERQARHCLSYLLSELGTTSCMNPTPPSDPVVRTEVFASHVVGAKTSSSAMMPMATLVIRSSLFSTTEQMASMTDLARVF